MEQPSRRTVLAAGALFAVHLGLPMSTPVSAERLHRRAQALAAGGEPPAALGAKATNLLHVATAGTALPGAERISLHRTAALAALTAALASQRMGRSSSGYLDAAHDHADAAHDGPLRAQALMFAASGRGAVDTLASALHHAGSGRSTAGLRAAIACRLAKARVDDGDQHGGLVELVAAEVASDLAVPAPDVVEEEDIRVGGTLPWRGDVLRRLGPDHRAEAITTLSAAVDLAAHPAGAMVSLARVDTDRAGELLMDAYLLAVRSGSRRAQAHVREAAAGLGVRTAVLRDVMG